MDNLMGILFICIAVPMVLMLFLLEEKARQTVGFMLVGLFVCLLASGVNGLLRGWILRDASYFNTTVIPITEEILKSLPIVLFAFLYSDRRETLLSISMALGIGFAVLENTYILVNGMEQVSVAWALVRGFGASLMHGICTAAVGCGISFVHKRRKLFFTGTYALLITAIIYHAIFNTLVQSRYPYAGVLLTLVTYIPLVVVWLRSRRTAAAS